MDDYMVAYIGSQPALERPERLTDDLIKCINDESIERYTAMLSVYNPNIRRGECRRYLEIHQMVTSETVVLTNCLMVESLSGPTVEEKFGHHWRITHEG